MLEKKVKVRQVELRTQTEVMIVWVDSEQVTNRTKRVHGHDGKWWNVHKLYQQILDTSRLHSDWRVGGLM